MNRLERESNHEPIIQVKDLSFQYFGSNRRVLDRIDLEVYRNEIILIAGHSGSGKSTLLRSINGLIPHQHAGLYEGSVVVDGLTVANTRMSELATKVGYIFQNPENQIFMFSVERDIAFGLENLRMDSSEIRKRVDEAMKMVGIEKLALRAPHELSDGQKQRVAIAGVLAMRPKVLILDEPTSLLDPFTARSMVSLVADLRQKLGMTIIIVEHRLDLVAKIATRMVVLDEGKLILTGSPREVLSKINVGLYGVNEPAIAKLAKLLGMSGERLPIDPMELSERLQSDPRTAYARRIIPSAK